MSEAPHKIWTIGHSSRSAEELLELLTAAGIEVVVDVRSAPWSRRHPWHGKEELERSLSSAGIAYRWMGASLGGHGRGGYDEHRTTPVYRSGLSALVTGAHTATALLCAERDPRHCHRRFIADDLAAEGLMIWHILDPGEVLPHQLTLDFEA